MSRRSCSHSIPGLALASLALLSAAASGADSWQSLDGIREAAARFVRAHLPEDGARRTLEAGRLDGRLRLARCASPLQIDFAPGSELAATTTVGVRCESPQPWRLYVPVRVRTRGPVVVARHPLARDAELQRSDLTVAERDLDALPFGYLADPAQAAGKRLTRAAARGAVITPAMVASSRLVRRGQRVTLHATSAGMEIRMLGKALSDGGLGQRIRVENLSSRQVVEGMVRSAELVEVLLD